MFFETNELFNTLNTFGINMSDLVGVQNLNNTSNDSSKFVGPSEGFQRGNLYRYEYKPYKDMNYILYRPTNEKEEKMLHVYELNFAILDLSFHLDLHPEDQNAFHLFKMYVKEYEQAKQGYEKLYGPLCLNDTKGEVYDWIDNPWPWDKDKGAMYV